MSIGNDRNNFLYLFRILAVLLLLLGVAAVGLFGVQQMGLHKYVVSALAALLMLGVMGVFNAVLLQEKERVEAEEEKCRVAPVHQPVEPEQYFS